MAQDKKVKRGKLTFILLEAIGRAVIAPDVDPALVRDFYEAVRKARSEARPERSMHSIAFFVVVGCLFVSAFFAASETALTGASRASMLRLSKQGNRQADIVSQLLDMRERLIGALLLGNNIANIGASALATGIFTAWFGEIGVLYATGVMTVLVVIFAEVLPKTIAFNAPDRIALAVARPMMLTLSGAGPAPDGHRSHRAGADEAARHQSRRKPGLDPVADRAPARRGRPAASRGQGRKARPRHAGRPARFARTAGLRRHGPSHRNGDDQRRPAAGRAGARGAVDRIHPHSAVARQAGKHHRRVARQGPVARDPRQRGRYVADRRLHHRAAALVRAGNAPASPSSSRRSAAARPTSPWSSTSMARSKAW